MATLQHASYAPVFCRAEAYHYFLEQMPDLHTSRGLLRAAIAISMHALDDVNPGTVEQRLEALSDRVCQRAPSRSVPALQANLHRVLFEEEGFAGNLERYYIALNSYLPAVLNTRRGLPIILSLIYKFVGESSGLVVEGVNAPGHFLVQVYGDHSWMIVDPFFSGQVLTQQEAFDRLDYITGRKLPRASELLATPSHDKWLTRMIGNLRQLFAAEGRRDDLAAMTELAQVLAHWYPNQN